MGTASSEMTEMGSTAASSRGCFWWPLADGSDAACPQAPAQQQTACTSVPSERDPGVNRPESAVSVMNCHRPVHIRYRSSESADQAPTFRRNSARSPTRQPSLQLPFSALSSHSAMFSQLSHFGV